MLVKGKWNTPDKTVHWKTYGQFISKKLQQKEKNIYIFNNDDNCNTGSNKDNINDEKINTFI